MKKALPALISFLSFLVGCKKDAKAPASGATTSSITSWNGVLEVGKIIHFASGSIQSTEYVGVASFGFGTAWEGDPSKEVTVDTVRLNGIPMMMMDSTYTDTLGFYTGTSQPITYPYTFKVAGKHGIPSFTYTENGPYPAYTGYANIPDTIYKNSGLTIPLTGVANADYISVDINDYSSLGGHDPSQQFSHSVPANISFSSSVTSQLNTTHSATVQIIFQKWDTQTFGGVPILFVTALNFSKTVSIK